MPQMLDQWRLSGVIYHKCREVCPEVIVPVIRTRCVLIQPPPEPVGLADVMRFVVFVQDVYSWLAEHI